MSVLEDLGGDTLPVRKPAHPFSGASLPGGGPLAKKMDAAAHRLLAESMRAQTFVWRKRRNHAYSTRQCGARNSEGIRRSNQLRCNEKALKVAVWLSQCRSGSTLQCPLLSSPLKKVRRRA